MRKISCNIIRDLLPLYADEVVSKDTKNFVEEHLTECPACRTELEHMRSPVILPPCPEMQEQDSRNLKALKQKLNRRRLLTALGAVLLTLLLVFCHLWYQTRSTTVEGVLKKIEGPGAPGTVLTQISVEEDLTLVLSRSADNPNELVGAVLDRQGPFYHLIRLMGKLPLAKPQPLKDGAPRAQVLFSWYGQEEKPAPCVVMGVALDEEVDRIVVDDKPLTKIEVDGMVLFAGHTSGDYDVYRLFDKNGRELDHWHGTYVE